MSRPFSAIAGLSITPCLFVCVGFRLARAHDAQQYAQSVEPPGLAEVMLMLHPGNVERPP